MYVRACVRACARVCVYFKLARLHSVPRCLSPPHLVSAFCHRACQGSQCSVTILPIGVALLVTLQTFDVLKAVGKHHTMSAGLVIGGKDLRDEQRLINAMMILVKPSPAGVARKLTD